MKDRVLKGLQKAIQTEVDGYYFYQMAADSMSDSKGTELFRKLAQEEMEHKQFLEKQYKSIKETGRVDKSASLGDKVDLSGENPIFSDDLKKRISDAHFEMTALSVAIRLELNSIQHYKAEAEAAEDEDVKNFFRELVDWETGHYDALVRQDEALKQDYWSAYGFAPF